MKQYPGQMRAGAHDSIHPASHSPQAFAIDAPPRSLADTLGPTPGRHAARRSDSDAARREQPHDRMPHDAERLDDQAVAFVAKLAGRVSLRHCADRFPHLVNELSRLAHDPHRLSRRIGALLYTDAQRSDEALSFRALQELTELARLFEARIVRPCCRLSWPRRACAAHVFDQ